MKDSQTKTWVDSVGGSLSLLCAIHCMAFPLLVSLGGAFSHGIVEQLFLLSAILFTALSLFQAYRRHHLKWSTVILFVLGMLSLVLSLILHAHSLSAFGGVVLAAGHFINWRNAS